MARSIVARMIGPEQARVSLFGSRARGGARRWSDIDLAVEPKGDLPRSVLAELRDAFETSNMLLNVDVVDLRDASAAIKQTVARDGVLWSGCSRPGGRWPACRSWRASLRPA